MSTTQTIKTEAVNDNDQEAMDPLEMMEDETDKLLLDGSGNVLSWATTSRCLTRRRVRLLAGFGLVFMMASIVFKIFSLSLHQQHPQPEKQNQEQYQDEQQQQEKLDDDFYFYNNLSCPLEWSKYSCSHQGFTERAELSLEQALQRKEAITDIFETGLLPFSRVLFVGDSTMRQIIIAVGCIAMAIDPNVEYLADWQDSWPCHGTRNCIRGGQHSGFSRVSIVFPNGAQVHFVPLGGSNGIHEEQTIVARFTNEVSKEGRITFGPNTALPIHSSDSYLNATDTLVFNIGLHNKLGEIGPVLQAFSDFSDMLRHQENRPQIVYMTTITQHFATPNGQYKGKKAAQEAGMCLDKIDSNPRAQVEREIVTGHVDQLIDYDDVEMGAFHIGGEDCTHYCMPGPPDLTAARLFQAVQQLQRPSFFQ